MSEFATTRTRVSLDNCNYYGSDLRRPSAYQDNLSNSGSITNSALSESKSTYNWGFVCKILNQEAKPIPSNRSDWVYTKSVHYGLQYSCMEQNTSGRLTVQGYS